MEHTLFQVDSFTQNVFSGNPAAVCVLEEWLSVETMQKIALENNLPETAFFVPSDDPNYDYHLRWFTPLVEMDLCGHATLAAGYCLFEELGFDKPEIRFQSRSGLLTVQKTTHGYTLNFPVWDYSVLDDVADIERMIGMKVKTLLKSSKLCAVVDADADAVRNFVPNIPQIKTLLDVQGLIITAQGSGETDFVSRFFAPQIGIDEDPVTGAIHCMLTPYWSGVLEKTTMKAKQLSAREGDLHLELKGDRVHISGHAVLYMKGTIHVG